MTTIFHEDDADLDALDGQRGRGRRLRQPGPVVGAEPARLGPRRDRCASGPTPPASAAEADGFDARPTSTAASSADVVCVLVPDDVIPTLPLDARRPTRW